MPSRSPSSRPKAVAARHSAAAASPVGGPGAVGIWWRLALIAAVGVLVYWNALSNPFIFDDHPTIETNPQIREWWNLPQVFAAEQGSPVAGRPFVTWTLALNYAMGGLDPRGYHIANLAIHVGCALLLLGLVRRTLTLPGLAARFGRDASNIALAAGLIWIVHPLNSEVVDYTAQRTEGLMALFYLLAMYASVRALTSKGRATAWKTGAVLSCAIGMACKEPMATAPLMIVLYDWTFEFRSLAAALRVRWRFYAALASTWIVLALLYWSGPREMSGGYGSTQVSPWTYLLNQTVVITHYLRLSIWPRGLTTGYGWTPPATLDSVWPYALFVTALFMLTLVALWRAPKVGWLGAWFFVTLAPTSSFLPIAAEVGAERRMYVPLMGLVVLAAIGAAWVLRRSLAGGQARTASRLPVVAGILIFLVPAGLGAATIVRNGEYASENTLSATMLERWPSGFAHHAVGVQLAAAGQHDEALAQLRAAVDGYPPARYELGLELFKLGRLDEAIAELERFVRDEPHLAETGAAHAVIGRAYASERRFAEAASQYQLALSAPVPDVTAQGRWADLLLEEQAFTEAIPHYQAYLAAYPNDEGALADLGVALISSGQGDAAVTVFRRAVTVNPANGLARENLARALLDRGDITAGTDEARQGAALRPNSPAAHDLLGRAYAAQHRLADARAEFERALVLDPSFADARDDLRRIGGA